MAVEEEETTTLPKGGVVTKPASTMIGCVNEMPLVSS